MSLNGMRFGGDYKTPLQPGDKAKAWGCGITFVLIVAGIVVVLL